MLSPVRVRVVLTEFRCWPVSRCRIPEGKVKRPCHPPTSQFGSIRHRRVIAAKTAIIQFATKHHSRRSAEC